MKHSWWRGAGLVAVCAVLTLPGPGPAQAEPGGQWQAEPGGQWNVDMTGADGKRVRASVALRGGRLSLTVRHGATVVVAPSALGVRTADTDFTTGLRFAGRIDRQIHETYQTKVGKRVQHTADAQEATLRFVKQGRPFDLVVRAAPDGIAYRYVLHTPSWVTVIGEASEFDVPQTADAFLLPFDNGRQDYESIHLHTTVATAQSAEYGYPALFRVGSSWLLITEADLHSTYGGSRVALDATTRRFRLVLPDPAEVTPAPLATPWRTMIVGSLATVTESDLVTDLAAPSKIADTSWIKPGAAAWSWWSEGATNNLARQQQYVDMAVKLGFEYNVVDAGWSASMIPPLVQYARERNVGIWIWVRWQQLDAQSERDRLFAMYKAWGVVGLKIDFPESDGQDRMRWYDAVIADAARYQLMLNFHGCTIPRGWERTWPHVLSMESVRGGEGTRPNPTRVPYPSSHYLTLPFTRNVVGSMDFTPVTFGGVRPTSDAHELALGVIYESGIQHFADGPERYASVPLAERLLRVVPNVWDETKLVSGNPADHVVLARHRGPDWFVGVGTAGGPRTVDVPLRFLPAGDWIVDLYHDGEAGALTLTTRMVTSGATLSQAVVKDGGFVAHVCPAQPGRTTCAS